MHPRDNNLSDNSELIGSKDKTNEKTQDTNPRCNIGRGKGQGGGKGRRDGTGGGKGRGGGGFGGRRNQNV